MAETPTATIEKINLYSSNNKTVINTRIFTELQKQSDKNKYSIKLLQCIDEKVTSYLTFSKELLYYFGNAEEEPNYRIPLFALKLAQNVGIITNEPITDQNIKQKRTDVKNYINSKCIIKDIDLLNPIYQQIINKPYKFYYETDFELELATDHLSYFCIMYQTSISNTSNNSKINSVRVTAENVINKSKLIPQTYAFYLENGELWTGEVRYDEEANRWKTYSPNTNYSRNVERKTFFNTKVQDHRILNKLSNLEFYYDLNEQFNITNRIVNRTNYNLNLQPITFVKTLSKGIEFQINLDTLLNTYSKIYRLYSKHVLVPNTEWIKVRVNRKRIKSNGSIYNEFLDNRPESWQGNLQIKEVPVSVNQTGQPHIIQCMVNDNDLSQLFTGEYYYTIDLSFQDPYYQQIKNDIDQLRINKQHLDLYYNLSNIPSSFNFELNTFTDKFRELTSEIKINDIVDTLCAKISVFTGVETGDIKQRIMTIISSNTGSPTGILTFKKLYEDVYYKILNFNNMFSSNTIHFVQKEFNKNNQIVHIVPTLPDSNFTQEQELKIQFGIEFYDYVATSGDAASDEVPIQNEIEEVAPEPEGNQPGAMATFATLDSALRNLLSEIVTNTTTSSPPAGAKSLVIQDLLASRQQTNNSQGSSKPNQTITTNRTNYSVALAKTPAETAISNVQIGQATLQQLQNKNTFNIKK